MVYHGTSNLLRGKRGRPSRRQEKHWRFVSLVLARIYILNAKPYGTRLPPSLANVR